ncbi:hypothetical protein RI129_005352 [Pyrocoelia pectoralis]|uniref:Major facilitator superfamily (MFS) profile domain-containing protein n=1 Tax=Pyrocoelia pectoralis TaxID=417401 RepID=A0AAN7VJS1_9COLE
MSIGYVTILIPSLTDVNSCEDIYLNENQTSWLSAVMSIMSLIGSIFSGVVAERFGRKRSMMFCAVPLFMSWMIYYYSTEFWHIVAALSIHGVTNGLIEAPVLSYVAEVAEPAMRGMLSATTTLFIVLGVFLEFIIGSSMHWKVAALVTSAVPILAFTLLTLVPETPYWFLTHNKPDQARKSLAWLRGWTTVENVEQEFQEIQKEFKRKSARVRHLVFEDQVGKVSLPTKHVSVKSTNLLESSEKYFKKSFLWPLSLVTFLFGWTSFAGILTLQTFGVIIFATLKVPINKHYATILMGSCQFIGTLLCTFIVPYCGKRITALVPISCLCICNICLGIYAYIYQVTNLDFTNSHHLLTSQGHQWIPLLLLMFMAFIAHCGPRNLPWTITGEVFSHETRGVGCGLSGGFNYLAVFIANKVYLHMVAVLSFPGVYWTYGCVCFIGLITVYFALPETEGKTLEEISCHFSGRVKLDNKVKRKTMRGSNIDI